MESSDTVIALAADGAELGVSEVNPIVASAATHTLVGPTLRDMHWELELGVVLSGSMERVTREWVSPVDPGMVWLCGSWEPHGYRIVRAPCSVVVFVVNPVYLARLSLDSCGDTRLYTPFAVPAEHRPQVPAGLREPLLTSMAHAGGSMHLNDRAWLSLALQQCLLYSTENWNAPPVQGRAEDRFSRLMPALTLAFGSRCHVGIVQAARACGLSRNAFASVFSRATGLTFADFALRRRLRGAAQALAHTDQPVKTIAADWGFADSSHLVKSFEQHYGLTPGAYRRGRRS